MTANYSPDQSTADASVDLQPEHSSLPLAIAMLFTLIVAVTCFLLNRKNFPINPDFLPTQVSSLKLESSEYQKRSYVFYVVALATVCISITRGWLRPEKIASDAVCAGLAVVLFPAIFLLSAWDWNNYHGFHLAILAMLSLCLLNKVPGWNGFLVPIEKALCSSYFLAAIFFVLLMVLWVRPLRAPVELLDFNELTWVDAHYSVTVLSGYELTRSEDGNRLKSLAYGFGMPVLTAVYLRASQFFSETASTLPMAVKFYQLIAALCIPAIFYVRDKKTWLLGTLVVLICVAYTLGNTGPGVKFPNHSGVRYLPLLLGLLGIGYELSTHRFRIWVLALIGGALLLANIETGLALTVGIVAALFFQGISASKSVFVPFIAIAKFLVLEIVTFSLFGATLIPLLLPDSSEFFRFLSVFGGSGFGGLKAKLSITACVVIIVAAFTLIENSYRARRDTLDHKAIWEVFVATLMLVWLTYYMNRMHEWNLWFQWLLLTLWSFSRFASEANSGNERGLIRLSRLSFAPSLLLAIVTAVTCGQGLTSTLGTIRPALALRSIFRPNLTTDDSAYLTSGFMLKGDLGREVKKHLDDLERFDKNESYVLSNLATLVRLRGFNAKAPMDSPWVNLTSYSQIPAARQAVLESGYRKIVVDGPNTSIASGDLDLKLYSHLDLLLGSGAVSRGENPGEWSALPIDQIFDDVE
jgi:hypothetical protein